VVVRGQAIYRNSALDLLGTHLVLRTLHEVAAEQAKT
jgi:hypothetical protein